MAYANHSCVPNAVHHSVTAHAGLKMLVASHEIAAGDEISHNYVGVGGDGFEGGQADVGQHIQQHWGFICTCIACTDDQLGAKLTQMRLLDRAIIECNASDVRLPGAAARFDEALRQGEELVAMYHEFRFSSVHLARTFYLLFQIAVTRRATLETAKGYIQKARDCRLAFLGAGLADRDLAMFERYVGAPNEHQAYLAAEA